MDSFTTCENTFRKVKIQDGIAKNSLLISISNEDHTLGNLLRAKLVENKNVLFAGYNSHNDNLVLNIQADNNSNPLNIVKETCNDLKSELDSLEKQLLVKLGKRNN